MLVRSLQAEQITKRLVRASFPQRPDAPIADIQNLPATGRHNPPE
jgi:hypothetical protein